MKGSQWNKWNIHVHTVGTNKNDQFSLRDPDAFYIHFFKAALQNGINAIGITDYFSIDNYKIAVQFLKEINSKMSGGEFAFTKNESELIQKIFILPNVELRMLPSTSSGKLINIHCIFNPDYFDCLENDFFNSIENQAGYKMNRADLIAYGKTFDSTTSDIKKLYNLGVDNYVIDPKTLKTLFENKPNLRDNTIVIISNSNKDGASGTQGHYEMFSGEPGALDGVRNSIYLLSDAIFSARDKDIQYFLGKRLDENESCTEVQKIAERQLVIKERGSLKACLVGCDAHNESVLFNRFTWIKGELNFQGLKQIIYEPDQRVKIQDVEPDLKEDKLVIEEVRFITKENSFTPKSIKLNKNLNVIIGGKSSGKSILLFAIAKTLLPDRSILKRDNSGHSYKYEFPFDFDFEVKIASGHTQTINRGDEET
ncbi:hypothetical protein ACFX5U_08585 [Sphingobacterium sp. SG20118]|uniref:hypothetical protein n=1 Tax=Sphingobacterium sp. SG20118 TaxID=3367156 RepID=UPI0037DFC72A